jgi:tetrahydromethanopterin S-methyltransferase subunit E
MQPLTTIKLLHTAAWAVFAGCILWLPVAALGGELRLAALLAAIVAVEVAVLVANGMVCPLTPIAARYTDDRRDNFDIYLPEWLARHNKTIFGALYVAGLLILAIAWMRQS